MSIVVRFSPTNLTTEQYDESIRKLEEADIDFPPDGMDHHLCFGTDGDLKVSEVWDSQEQLEAFGKDLMPILQDVGIQFSGEPEVYEVHNAVRR